MKRSLGIVVAIACVFFVGCKSKPATKTEDETKKGDEMAKVIKNWEEPKKVTIDQGKKYMAVIRTSKGTVQCELFAKEAPLSVTNFKYLADGGFYNGLTFHRVEPGFVVQGGDPTATGSGGPGYTIPAEISPLHKHVTGALAWARTPDQVNPERRSSGSQFYITLDETPFLDGGYTVFGQTTSGMDVVEKISVGDVIESIEVKEE